MNLIHERSTPLSSETHGIAERAVRRVTEGTSSVSVQSGLQESWLAVAMECYCFLRNVQDPPADGQTPHERRINSPFEWPITLSGAEVPSTSYLHKTKVECISLAQKSFLEYSWDTSLTRRKFDW